MKESKPDLVLDCEMEYARMHRMRKRLQRMKDNAKNHAAQNTGPIKLPKAKVKAEPTQPLKVRHTYTVLDRIESGGWPMFSLERSDGKKRTVSPAKFRKLQDRGKIVGFVPAPPVNEKFQKARTPPGAFAIQVGAEGYRVDIVYSISDDWKDLMCYSHKLKRMVHLKREDLYPKDNVNEAIAFLKQLDENERKASKHESKES